MTPKVTPPATNEEQKIDAVIQANPQLDAEILRIVLRSLPATLNMMHKSFPSSL